MSWYPYPLKNMNSSHWWMIHQFPRMTMGKSLLVCSMFPVTSQAVTDELFPNDFLSCMGSSTRSRSWCIHTIEGIGDVWRSNTSLLMNCLRIRYDNYGLAQKIWREPCHLFHESWYDTGNTRWKGTWIHPTYTEHLSGYDLLGHVSGEHLLHFTVAKFWSLQLWSMWCVIQAPEDVLHGPSSLIQAGPCSILVHVESSLQGLESDIPKLMYLTIDLIWPNTGWGYIYNVGPPSCKLVYKPHNYSYKYHKP